VPNKAGDPRGYIGWAFCAHTPERDLFLLYFEKDCPQKVEIRMLRKNSTYIVKFFDPREGKWFSDPSIEKVTTTETGTVFIERIQPELDWGMSLVLEDN